MSTLAKIEADVATLSPAEMEALEKRLHELNLARRAGRKVFTGSDAVEWWRGRKHMSPEDGEEFARDVEAARRNLNSPPKAPGWE
jgi:hypothetical protein